MLPLQVAHSFLNYVRTLSRALSNAPSFLSLDGAALILPSRFRQPECKAPLLPAVDPLSVRV